ncbi:hypothetical protein LJR129_002827 [Acidovorax sp. LjRoot129]|uniref:hypothetical protein n=1 Tax=Acidovorax sp. LjRoot129 TaxID=3342260 RepID=UPI003ECC239C
MDSHEQLHRTLRAAAQLLDSAASQIRDLPLHPTRENIRLVAEALAITFQVRRNVEVELPALAKQHPEPIEEDSAANKRLGDALVAADDMAEGRSNAEAAVFLEHFARQEPSAFHRDLALLEAGRYRLRDEA